ncbi:MAG TPA: PCRF domain-containing protein, partial [Actinomycetota bacterium]|nr:PCRF domain-containing protein [Actinomycetota bacterium]
MRERLDRIETRYEELTRELSRPEVASDLARLRDLGRKRAELEEVVTVYRRYRDALQQAEEARDLERAEQEPEMAEYLRA